MEPRIHPKKGVKTILKADLHIHSNINSRLPYFPLFYDSVQSVEQILLRAISLSIQIISITDHDSMAGYYKAQNIIAKKNLHILLLPGCEISSRDGHILAYNIRREIQKGMSAQETIDAIHAQEGIAVAAHPFNFNSLGTKIFHLPFDGLEGFNSTTTIRAMLKVYYASKSLKIPNLAGSDAHQIQEIGRSLMLFPESVHSVEDLIKSIKSADFKVDFTRTNILTVVYRHIIQNTRFFYEKNIALTKAQNRSLSSSHE